MGPPEEVPRDPKEAKEQSKKEGRSGDTLDLSPEARRELETLITQDRQVRAHEAAHMAAGGSLVKGGASYGYKRGPDGQMYAVSGEVTLDTSPEKDPRATLAKAERIRAAAMAPADPSPQDRRVASEAGAMAAKAASELASQGVKLPGARLNASSTGQRVDFLV